MDIEDYALIGDCETAALVGRNGSIDWLCWPRFDSGACFAALLGTRDHGRWRIAPVDAAARTRRAYREDTMILETSWETASGAVTVIDFMPIRDGLSDLVRIVVGRRGTVEVDMEILLRFDYGESIPWVTQLTDANGICAVAGPDMVVLASPVELSGRDFAHVARFEVAEGERLAFTLTYTQSHLGMPPPVDADAVLDQTEAFWKQWCERCTVEGEWIAPVRRSLMVLKALTYAPTGGIVAAPTTSLPEQRGGVRNWDYRYCWLRDATLTLLALMNGGYREEAVSWRNWLVRAVAGSPAQIQIMYSLSGERRLREETLDWLPGFANSAPVRVGNAAFQQLQLDVYGEVMDVLHQARQDGMEPVDAEWDIQCALLAHLETVWQEADEGMWEVRGPRRHFTYSKILCWVAFDRGIKGIEDHQLKGPIERWRAIRDAIHLDVCRNGYSEQAGAFVQSYGSTELDASLLLIASTGFLPWDDPRVIATVEAIRRSLTVDGLVMRYRSDPAVDGLPPGEGVFLACSFWLADALCAQGRWDEARTLFERLLVLCNDVGLLSEEYDPAARQHLGNFPQAFSHVALINTAFNLGRRRKPARQRSNGTAR